MPKEGTFYKKIIQAPIAVTWNWFLSILNPYLNAIGMHISYRRKKKCDKEEDEDITSKLVKERDHLGIYNCNIEKLVNYACCIFRAIFVHTNIFYRFLSMVL